MRIRLKCRHCSGPSFQCIQSYTRPLAFGRTEVTVSGKCDGCGKLAVSRVKTSRPDRVTY